MDTATVIGFAMLVTFLIAVIITIWKDTRREKRFWQDRQREADKNKKLISDENTRQTQTD